MESRLVLVRALGGRPSTMLQVGHAAGVAFLSKSELLAKVQAGEVQPIRVPTEDVFPYDGRIFEQLSSEWDKGLRPPPSWSLVENMLEEMLK